MLSHLTFALLDPLILFHMGMQPSETQVESNFCLLRYSLHMCCSSLLLMHCNSYK